MGLIKNIVDYTNDATNGKHQIHLDAVYDMVGQVKTSLRSLLAGKADTNHIQSTSTITGLNTALANLTNLLGLKEISSNKIHSLASRPENNALYPDAQIVYDALAGKADLAISQEFTGINASNKINVDDLESGKLYFAVTTPTLGLQLSQMFNGGTGTLCFTNWIDETTRIGRLLFRYYKVQRPGGTYYYHVIEPICNMENTPA